MQQKYWYHSLPGVVAALGWTCIFVYILLLCMGTIPRDVVAWLVVLFVLTLGAGAFNAAIALPKQKKKGAKKEAAVFVQRPGVH